MSKVPLQFMVQGVGLGCTYHERIRLIPQLHPARVWRLDEEPARASESIFTESSHKVVSPKSIPVNSQKSIPVNRVFYYFIIYLRCFILFRNLPWFGGSCSVYRQLFKLTTQKVDLRLHLSYSRAQSRVIQDFMRLTDEPTSKSLHICV